MSLALCSIGAEEIERRLRMPLSFVRDNNAPEDICERVADMVRKRLNAGGKSSTCESVAFKVCKYTDNRLPCHETSQ